MPKYVATKDTASKEEQEHGKEGGRGVSGAAQQEVGPGPGPEQGKDKSPDPQGPRGGQQETCYIYEPPVNTSQQGPELFHSHSNP